MSGSRAFAASAALAAGLAAVAFTAAGGTDLARLIGVEIAIVLSAGALIALAVLRADARALHGAGALVAFAALAALTGLSIEWSITPDLSLEETGRTFAYLAVFAGALAAARLTGGATRIALGGLMLAAAAIIGWALATRIWPGSFGGVVLGARLGEPFDYWNALACVAAITVVPALWLATRRDGAPALRALAYPLIGSALLVILLTQSRGGLFAAAAATALWIALAPLRLRSLGVLAVCSLAIAPVATWALSQSAFTEAMQPPAERAAVAGDFGLFTLLTVAALAAVGFAAQRLRPRLSASLPVRRRAGIVLASAAILLPLGVLAAATATDGGLGGSVSDRLNELTSETAAPERGAARLGSVSSERGEYWSQAWEVLGEHPIGGAGAGSYGIARLPYRKNRLASRFAHGFVPQTAADLGGAGLLAALALLALWAAAAARAAGFTPHGLPRPEWDGERTAILALALAAFGYGIASTIDWTWFVPGPTVMALMAAGFVAGRGPLAPVGAGDTPPAEPRGSCRRRPSALRSVVAAAVVVTAVLCAVSVYQPQRAANANDRALDALAEERPAAALDAARKARDIDPLSPAPLYTQALVLERLGDPVGALRALETAIREHPADPEPWVRLARFELQVTGDPVSSIAYADAALRRDPYSTAAISIRLDALRQGGALPPGSPAAREEAAG